MDFIYSVPIIPQNLNKQETIVQIAEVLEHLSNVTEDIIQQIDIRIEKSNKKMLELSERISEVSVKTEKLNGAKKATQVFSSSKYPAVDINTRYVSIFSNAQPREIIRRKIKYKQIPSNDEPLSKLQIYHVKVKENEDVNKIIDCLGEIPHDIKSVNDLLLYNSGKNLYKEFVMSDALQVKRQIKESEVLDNYGIGSAPHSIRERSTLTRSSTKNYFYSPNLGQVPELEVPIDLPDLPGIADDLRYNNPILDQGIAPSVITSPNIPELPTISEIIDNDKGQTVEEFELPAPPPPLPINKTIEPQPQENEKSITQPLPPPLPPPLTEEIPQKATNDEYPKKPPENTPVEIPVSNARADLMEAIRKAGGSKNAKLKSTNAAKKETVTTSGGGDLIADLHAKLSMRRKGISGAKKNTEVFDATSALERISAMIPPPSKNDFQENNTEDDEWDDD